MRIKCGSIDEFLANLRGADVYRGIVHYSREKEPVGGKPSAESHVWDFWYRVSAVLQFDDGGQALLEAVERCGRDRLTSDGDRAGSERQAELHEKILAECRDRNLRTLPGIVDLS